MRVRTKKNICVAVGLLAFLAMLGVVGGMEWGGYPLLARRGSERTVRADSSMRLVQGRGIPA